MAEKPCPRCGRPVEVAPIQVLGRDWTPAVTCPECTAQEAAEREAEHAARHPVFSHEEWVRGKLEGLGVNVPLHGRFSLTHALRAIDIDAVANAVDSFVYRVLAAGRWEPVRGLIIEGPTGVGKSWLAVGIIRELLECRTFRASEIRYDRSRHVWGLIRSGYSDGTANAELEARMRARLWVLDDLGTEHPTEDTAANLTEILSARELRPTLITANIPREAHGLRYDPAVWSRIKSRLGDRNFEVIQITGRDRRLRAPDSQAAD